MNSKALVVVLAIIALTVSLSTLSFAAVEKPQASAPAAPTPAHAMPIQQKANFGMLVGTITSIDSTDPANVKLQVKNDTDGSINTVSVTPWTNVTKVTDISELKTGELVRMTTRKVDDKDVAMNIMFGKMKAMPTPVQKPKT